MSETIWNSLAQSARRMAAEALSEADSLRDWEKIRGGRRGEFLRALGIGPLPERCDPGVIECGEERKEGYRARKIGFQILPDCWASAVVYYPDPLPKAPAPGVLYVCGHAEIGTLHYHPHGILWARRGYVCLMLDTIEQNDNPGEHHGFNLARGEAWLSLGYSSAGGEVWNSMRGLDVLEADPAVDPARIGVTGVSGGGSLSFLLAIADERIRAVSTLCGISPPPDAIAGRGLLGNCDCFYPHNIFGRDWSEYAALIAPRAAQFCFAEHDPLFHPGEIREFVERTSKIFRLYDAADRCRLVMCPGDHGDHPEFDEATQQWFDRHVAGEERPLLERGPADLGEIELSVFHGLPPAPNRLDLLPHLVTRRGGIPLPRTPDQWPEIRGQALEALRGEVFPLLERAPREAFLERTGDWRWGETPVREHTGRVDGVEIRLRMVTPPSSAPKLLVAVGREGENAMHAMVAAATNVDTKAVACAGFEPRWAGDRSPPATPGDAPPGSRLTPVRTSLLRAMAIAGVTPVMWTVRDLLVLIDYLETLDEMRGRKIYLYGKGDAGIAALYCGILDERVAGVVLEDIPSSHLDGAPVLGILRVLDLPHAAGLLFPRKVALVNPVYVFWNWPHRLYARMGRPDDFRIIQTNAREALEFVLA